MTEGSRKPDSRKCGDAVDADRYNESSVDGPTVDPNEHCSIESPGAGCEMPDKPTYWFPAKRYGWGWGLPTAWQGWVVMAIFALLLLAGAVTLLPSHGPVAFVAYAALLCVLLLAVCWLKGEPPAWRWGEK